MAKASLHCTAMQCLGLGTPIALQLATTAIRTGTSASVRIPRFWIILRRFRHVVRDVCSDIHLVAKVNEDLDNHVDCNIVVFSYSMGLDEGVDANEVGFIMSDQCFEFVSQFSHDWVAALVEFHELAAVDSWSP